MKRQDLKGKNFHFLNVVSRSATKTTSGGTPQTMWLCVCKCGNSLNVRTIHLKSGNTKSCGCLQREVAAQNGRDSATHGLKFNYIYGLWSGLKSRCENKHDKAYSRYGGRGISVCRFISKSPANLLSVLGERPIGRHPSGRPVWTIDRIDNNGGYWCGKCRDCVSSGRIKNIRWATSFQQNQNSRSNRMVYFNGRKMCLAQASRKTKIHTKKIIKMAELSKGGFNL